MTLKNNLSGFSFVELVVVISILAILSTISFLSFSSFLVDARNSDRTSNMGEMKIGLKTTKQRNGAYPIPGNKSTLFYSGSGIAYQGFFNQSLAISTITQIPTDPKVANQYYGYATTFDRQLFQIGMSTENSDGSWISYVDGDYKTVAKTILPSLLTSTGASQSGITVDITPGTSIGEINRKTFVLNNGIANLIYDGTGTPKIYSGATLDFTGITTAAGVSIVESTDYSSCQDIFESGRSIGPGTYGVIDTNGNLTNTGCLMSPPNY